jgi:RHS repeat-associated protein
LIESPDPDNIIFGKSTYGAEPILLASVGSLAGILDPGSVAQTRDQRIYYYLNDHLGTPITVIDEDNTVVWAADYKPFGQAEITIDTFENNFRFPGQYYDKETGFHYNYHRYYQPQTGRYLRADPIGLKRKGINLFVFVENRPLNLIDLFGLEIGDILNSYEILHGRKPKPYMNANQSLRNIREELKRAPRLMWEDLIPDPPKFFDPCIKIDPRDLNRDGKVDGWDDMLWFFARRYWDLMTPPLTPYPPGYGNGGPGSNGLMYDIQLPSQ